MPYALPAMVRLQRIRLGLHRRTACGALQHAGLGVGIAVQPWGPANKHCSAACLTGTVRESPYLSQRT